MKTKIIFSAMFFYLFATSAFAQLETNIPQYEKGQPKYKWSISAAVNSAEAQMDQMLFNTWEAPYTNYYSNYGNKQDKSVSLSIIPKYQIADEIFLRFEFGITSINLQSHFNGIGDTVSQNQGQAMGSARTIADDNIQQTIYRYAAGIQWNFMKKKFIETYFGASLNYFHYSEMHWSLDITGVLPFSNNIDNRNTNYTSFTPGGFATGIGTFAGFNVYLHKRVSLGGEFSYSILYYKLGGIENGVTEQIFPTTPTEILNWKVYNNASKGIEFSKVMPSLNLTIHF